MPSRHAADAGFDPRGVSRVARLAGVGWPLAATAAAVALAAALLLALPGQADAKLPTLGVKPLIGVQGAAAHTLEVCGARRRTTLAGDSATLRARAMLARRNRSTRRALARRPARAELRVRDCTAGLSLAQRRRFGLSRRRSASLRLGPGDYRVELRVRFRGRTRLAVAYLRIERELTSVPVAFEVRNVNRSRLPCPSDGGTYVLRGQIVAPPSLLAQGAVPPAATVYLHGPLGRFFWGLSAVPAYNYATALAERGHASIAINRLGYLDSSGGNMHGSSTCIGAQADMAAQILSQLRAGSYQAEGAVAVRFGKLALAGHSAGGAVATLAAHSFGEIDALVLMGWADSGFSTRAINLIASQNAICARGGEPSQPGGPGGYAYYGSSYTEADQIFFRDAEPNVITAANALRTREPCGEVASITYTGTVNARRVGEIAVPVLLVYGAEDALYTPTAPEGQRDRYTGSKDVTLRIYDDTGHALILERTGPQIRADTATWLAARGL